MLTKIIDKGNIEDMYKLNEMLDELICDLKEQKPKLYKEYKKQLYELAYGNVILEDKAIEIVVNKAGVSENDLYSKNANYDYDHGQYIVEVEIDTKSTEYDAKIDAVSGNVLEWNSKNERVNSYINLNGVISLDKAIEIVVAEKNIDTNKILAKKASYDYERGKTVIGVEIYVDGFEYDVELDAMTGAVQKWN